MAELTRIHSSAPMAMITDVLLEQGAVLVEELLRFTQDLGDGFSVLHVAVLEVVRHLVLEERAQFSLQRTIRLAKLSLHAGSLLPEPSKGPTTLTWAASPALQHLQPGNTPTTTGRRVIV